MNALEYLLEKRWILKSQDSELYYRIKNEMNQFKEFYKDKLGYSPIVTPHLIKLDKYPGEPRAYMGLEDFGEKMDYIFLCGLLMFLEDKAMEEQFVLSELTEYLEANYTRGENDLEGVDWTLYGHRKALIKVIKFAELELMIHMTDGSIDGFAEDLTEEVLYENTGASRFFMRRFQTDIMACKDEEDLRETLQLGQSEEKGIHKRYRVYRRLMMEPMVYQKGSDDEDFIYIKSQRHGIQEDFSKNLGLDLHLHKNMATIIVPENTPFKRSFPDNKTISMIVLQLSAMIRVYIEEKYEVTERDLIYLSAHQFEELVQSVKEAYGSGWSKSYREMKLTILIKEIIALMGNYGMLELDQDGRQYILYPILGKLIGRYPATYQDKGGDSRNGAMEN